MNVYCLHKFTRFVSSFCFCVTSCDLFVFNVLSRIACGICDFLFYQLMFGGRHGRRDVLAPLMGVAEGVVVSCCFRELNKQSENTFCDMCHISLSLI